MKDRTNEADASSAKMSNLLEERAADIRVLMAQLEKAQQDLQMTKVLSKISCFLSYMPEQSMLISSID